MAYITTDDLASYLGIEDTESDSGLGIAVAAACKAVDNYTGRTFELDAEASSRAFEVTDPAGIYIDDLSSLSGVVVKTDDGTGTFATTLAATRYQFIQEWPDGPYSKIRALVTPFPVASAYERTQLLQITGVWGWPAVPADVKQAALIEASRLYHRRNSPQGVAGFGEFGAIRVARSDSDFGFLLNPYRINFGIA